MCNRPSRTLFSFHQSFTFYSISLPCSIKVFFLRVTRHNYSLLLYFLFFFTLLNVVSVFYWREVKNPTFLPFRFLFVTQIERKLKNSTGRTREQQQSGLKLLNELKYKIRQVHARIIFQSSKEQHKTAFGFFSNFGFCSCVPATQATAVEKKVFQPAIDKSANIVQGKRRSAVGRSPGPMLSRHRQPSA